MTVPEPEVINILIFGGGAIGALYAWFLSRNTQQRVRITVVCRSNYEAVRQHGFVINSAIFGRCVHRPDLVLSSSSPPSATETYDYVLVTTKTLPRNTPLPLAAFSKCINSSTTIVLIQNGIFTEAPYCETFLGSTILSCVSYMSVEQTAPGVVMPTNETQASLVGIYSFGSRSEDSSTHPKPSSYNSSSPLSSRSSSPGRSPADEALNTFVGMLQSGGAQAQAISSSALHKARWTKLLYNGAFNTLCAVMGLNTVDVVQMQGALAQKVVGEIASVARACGVDMDEAVVEGVLPTMLKRGPFRPSMLQDLDAGRQMEVEAIVGNVVRAGKKRSIEVETYELLYRLLTDMNAKNAAHSADRA